MRRLGGLSAHPHVDAVFAPVRRRVQRLHRRVRQIGNLIDRLDQFRGSAEGRANVAIAAAIGERPIERRAIFGAELLAVSRRRWAEIPHDRHRLERFLGAPEIVGDDRHAIGHGHGGDDPPAAGDCGKVVGFELAAEHRAIRGGGIGHARQAGVDTEAGRARDLERRVYALEARADKLVLVGRLDRRLSRERKPSSVRSQFAVSRRAPGGLVTHEAATCDARARLDAPSRRRRRDKPRAGRGAGLLQEHARAAHRPGAACPHGLIDIVVGKVAVGGGVLDLHLREIAF